MWVDENSEGRQALQALGKSIARFAAHGRPATGPIPGLTLFRHDGPTEPLSITYEPSVCLVAQGRKSVSVGDETFVYDANNYLVTSVHVPGMVHIIEATADMPYLGLALKLDQRELSQLILDTRLPAPPRQPSGRGVAISGVTLPLLAAFQRLIDLLSDERDIPILAPMIQREILYRLLTGDHGERLRQMASAGSQTHQIAQAITWLKENFRLSVSIDELASRVCMSPSTFYHHFRTMTAVSPLQFQKQLRLQEARRLMLEERVEAATAAFHVGYESPSQFNREYNRLFGAPPLRDITNYRRSVTA